MGLAQSWCTVSTQSWLSALYNYSSQSSLGTTVKLIFLMSSFDYVCLLLKIFLDSLLLIETSLNPFAKNSMTS